MCGILGAIPSVQQTKFEQALKTIAHRGPDGRSTWHLENEISLGHARLAILDVSHSGDQPMHYADRYSLVFNGEIYNFLEVKKELQKLGHHFNSDSDSEVLLVSYAQWKEKCVEKFNGMWAFAIWDRLEKQLFVSRDRMGEKPLFYVKSNTGFIFASEQKALLPFLDNVNIHDNFQWMVGNSYGYESTSECLFADIRRFPAGHIGVLKNKEFDIRPYWSIFDSHTSIPEQYEEQVEYLRELLLDSCKLRMRADVAIGTGLSGGVDSSAVAATLASSLKDPALQRLPNSCQNAFVASFPGTDMDESHLAQKTAGHLGINYIPVSIDPQEYANKLEHFTYLFEEVHEVNPLPQIRLYGAMREHGVIVTLDGHGGDELFCGYESSPLHAIPEALFSKRQINEILATYRELHPDSEHFQAMSLSKIIAYLCKAKIRMLRDHGFRLDNKINKHFSSLNSHLFDLSFVSVLPTLLRNYDRYAMINGVEIRMPILDHRIVEFAFALPWRSKVRNGYTKSILRDAVSPWLTEDVIWRKSKIGFAPPLIDWMKGPLKPYICDEIASTSFNNSALIDPKKVASDIKKIMSGKINNLYESEQVWKKFNVYLWEKVFLKQIRQ